MPVTWLGTLDGPDLSDPTNQLEAMKTLISDVDQFLRLLPVDADRFSKPQQIGCEMWMFPDEPIYKHQYSRALYAKLVARHIVVHDNLANAFECWITLHKHSLGGCYNLDQSEEIKKAHNKVLRGVKVLDAYFARRVGIKPGQSRYLPSKT